MKNYEAHKAAKVRGQNAINAFFNKNVPLILAQLKPLIGQKVELQTGGFAQNLRKVYEEIKTQIGEPAGFRYRIYTSHGYSLWMEGDKCEGVPDEFSCHYMKQSFCLGNLRDGILTEIYDSLDRLPDFCTDLTVEGIELLLKEADTLEKKARALRSSVEPFGNGLHGH